jgi:hypothetical protein
MLEALNLLVFREDRRLVCGRQLKSGLLRQLQTLAHASSLEAVEAALFRAGELECAAADAGGVGARAWMDLTDRLAEKLVAPHSPLDVGALTQVLDCAPLPDPLFISPAEGFAYYALHPLAFAGILDTGLDEKFCSSRQIAVLGIRSIGTTLSAVAAAAARARGFGARRITVRPTGHPYNRHARFSAEELRFVQELAAAGAFFLVVDEGPGLSGSSFLSVAEALTHAGVARERIVLVCGREPDMDALRADDGPQRARRFRWLAVSSEPRRPREAELFIGGGRWRELMLQDEQAWPASWTSFERLKYLSSVEDRERRLLKFVGFGHYGEQVVERERIAADALFAPLPQLACQGFASYALVAGRPMHAGDLSANVLAHLAEYCAFRMRAFSAEPANLDALPQMAEHNLRQLGCDRAVALKLEQPVIADGRMQPHEWLLADGGRMLKTDSGSHGDDHFFPGITDIAWDLAGAIVEWRMDAAQSDMFLEAYRRAAGDDSRLRIGDFIIAYTTFRCAYCRMAANALQGSKEQARLEQAAAGYRQILSSPAPRPTSAPLPVSGV